MQRIGDIVLRRGQGRPRLGPGSVWRSHGRCEAATCPGRPGCGSGAALGRRAVSGLSACPRSLPPSSSSCLNLLVLPEKRSCICRLFIRCPDSISCGLCPHALARGTHCWRHQSSHCRKDPPSLPSRWKCRLFIVAHFLLQSLRKCREAGPCPLAKTH